MSTDILDAPPAEAPRWRIVSKIVDEHNTETGEFQEMWLVALSKEIPFRMNTNATEYGMTDHVIVTNARVHKAFGVEEFTYGEFCVVPSDEKGVAEEAFIYKVNTHAASYGDDEDDRSEYIVQTAMFAIGMF